RVRDVAADRLEKGEARQNDQRDEESAFAGIVTMGMPVTTVPVPVAFVMPSVAVRVVVRVAVRVVVRVAVRVVVRARVPVVRVNVLVVICPSHRRLPRQLSASAAI